MTKVRTSCPVANTEWEWLIFQGLNTELNPWGPGSPGIMAAVAANTEVVNPEVDCLYSELRELLEAVAYLKLSFREHLGPQQFPLRFAFHHAALSLASTQVPLMLVLRYRAFRALYSASALTAVAEITGGRC